MKRIINFIVVLMFAAVCRGADGELFPYPQPPADMIRLDERCDFIISRFWRQCDFKSAMSQSDKLRTAFGNWIGMMPYANADTVHSAIDRLLASVEKSGPQTLALARMAEEFTYTDSSEIKSAEIFLPFAKAAASHKKIPAADKNHFSSMVRKIENSLNGEKVKHFEFITPEGTKQNLDNYRTQMVVVVFNEQDCPDCSLSRVRLSADYNINKLIERGLLTLVYLTVTKPDNEWIQQTVGYPSNWVVGAMPDAAEWFELNTMPSIMLLDGRHKVLAKDISVDGLMGAMASMSRQSGF